MDTLYSSQRRQVEFEPQTMETVDRAVRASLLTRRRRATFQGAPLPPTRPMERKMPPKLNEVFIIREASCPLCGTKGGYAGFSGFDCAKPGCKNHKPNPAKGAALTVGLVKQWVTKSAGWSGGGAGNGIDASDTDIEKLEKVVGDFVALGPGWRSKDDWERLSDDVSTWAQENDVYITDEDLDHLVDDFVVPAANKI